MFAVALVTWNARLMINFENTHAIYDILIMDAKLFITWLGWVAPFPFHRQRGIHRH